MNGDPGIANRMEQGRYGRGFWPYYERSKLLVFQHGWSIQSLQSHLEASDGELRSSSCGTAPTAPTGGAASSPGMQTGNKGGEGGVILSQTPHGTAIYAYIDPSVTTPTDPHLWQSHG